MDTTKKIAIHVVGAIIGAVAGYFAGGLIVYKLEELEAFVDDDEEEIIDTEAVVVGDTAVYVESKNKNIGKRQKKEVVKTDYNKFYKNRGQDLKTLEELAAPYNSLEAGMAEIMPDAKAKEPERKPKQHIITLDEFTASRFDTRNIIYYEGDNIFADATTDETIPNPNDIFGPNIHLHFGDGSDDPDIVYVRDESISVDYDITKVHGSYSVIILGEEEKVEKEEKQPKHTKNKNKNKPKKETEEDEGSEE